MKLHLSITLGAVALCTTSAFAQESGLPPTKTAVITTQRVGDLIVQSTVTPTWYVPNGVAVAVPAGQQYMMAPPQRPLVQPLPEAQAPAPVQNPAAAPVVSAQVTTVVVAQPTAAKDVPEVRKGTSAWKQKVDALAVDLESNKLALVDAQAQLVVSAEEEKRAAEEQVAAALRRLDASKKQAERASAYAAALQGNAPAPTSPANQKAPELVAPVAPEPMSTFTLRRQDRTIPAALTRWSEESGYTLLWEAKEDPASFEETYTKPFPDAVDDVIRALRIAGRDFLMCEYKNKVVRIVPRSATCKINPPTENKSIQLGATE